MSCLFLKHIRARHASRKLWHKQCRVGRRFDAAARHFARQLAAEVILAEYPTIMLSSRSAVKKPFIFKAKASHSQVAAPQTTTVSTIEPPQPAPANRSQPSPKIVNIVTPGKSRLLSGQSGWRGLAHPGLISRPGFTHADLINAESRLGSTIFGPIPAGHRREFFHDHQGIWIWHENWHDLSMNERELTVRYEVRKSGVYKKISAGNYFKLEGWELENFRRAAHAYLKVIKAYLYKPTPVAHI